MKRYNGLILNSMGRCGSTLLYDFVLNSCISEGFEQKKSIFLPKITNDIIFNYIYKTHSRVVPENVMNFKFIYQYANPIDVILSTLFSSRLNREVHAYHMDTNNNIDIETCLKKDCLGLREHFNNWTKKNPYKTMLIHYESMWDNLDKICDFCDIKKNYISKFPTRKIRTFNRNNPKYKETADLVKDKYSDLIELIENNKYCKIIN